MAVLADGANGLRGQRALHRRTALRAHAVDTASVIRPHRRMGPNIVRYVPICGVIYDYIGDSMLRSRQL